MCLNNSLIQTFHQTFCQYQKYLKKNNLTQMYKIPIKQTFISNPNKSTLLNSDFNNFYGTNFQVERITKMDK